MRRATKCADFLKNALQFLSTLSLRRATQFPRRAKRPCKFLSTLSLRRATSRRTRTTRNGTNFYPRSPCGERLFDEDDPDNLWSISIHALLAESDALALCNCKAQKISIHALLAESDILGIPNQVGTWISIHALLAESDPHIRSTSPDRPGISIHALLAESDAAAIIVIGDHHDFYPRSPCGERLRAWICTKSVSRFLSTLSLRRATTSHGQATNNRTISIHALLAESDFFKSQKRTGKVNFYPRSPCGERLAGYRQALAHCNISIHALLAESDCQRSRTQSSVRPFLSTLSLRRATTDTTSAKMRQSDFYPRSPCGERPVTARIIDPTFDFYPRSPCGERRRFPPDTGAQEVFLSTLSLRRATHYGWSWYDDFTISIHALLAESDVKSFMRNGFFLISIHALLAESDSTTLKYLTAYRKFLSTLSLRRAT